MVARLIGVETEYAMAALDPSGRRSMRGRMLGELMKAARDELIHLPGAGDHGMFLANGGRFYLDIGAHPEVCTPECPDPWQAVRYVKAGDRILERLLRRIEARYPTLSLLVFRGNVDYSGSRATWGCHESYLHRTALERLSRQMVPHLVTRILYAGAGGFDPLSPGIRFTLSPRAAHLVKVVSNASTGDRGIFHTRDESLCGHGYRRLHVLCGDSLCSETSLWLTLATTALVVAVIDSGQDPARGVHLADPLGALHAIAGDLTFTRPLRLTNGKQVTALDIQRHYLAAVRERLAAGELPDWAPEACDRWQSLLDRLEQRPGELCRTLDWEIKLELYRDYVRGQDLDWESFELWSTLLEELEAAVDELPGEERLTLKQALALDSPVRSVAERLERRLVERGLTWNDVDRVLHLRARLLELEIRYSQIGPKSLLGQLQTAGRVNHRMPGVTDVDRAMSQPPPSGRARLRGQLVTRLAANGGGLCSWDRVFDRENRRALDLSDPFETEERWVRRRPLERLKGPELFE